MRKVARKKLFIDESRLWNLEEPAAGVASNIKTKLRSVLLGYMWYDVHVESLLNIRGSSRNLVTMRLTEKITFLENLVDTFIKLKDKIILIAFKEENRQFLYPDLNTQLIFFLVIKWGVFFYQNFSTIKGQKILNT